MSSKGWPVRKAFHFSSWIFILSPPLTSEEVMRMFRVNCPVDAACAVQNCIDRPVCAGTWHNDVIKSIPSTTSAQLGTVRSEFLIIAYWEKSIKFRFIENKKSDINETGLDVFINYITTKYRSILRPFPFSFKPKGSSLDKRKLSSGWI